MTLSPLTLAAITLTAPAMLAGLGLVALPIVAHLLHRKARRRVVFPSLQWLADSSASQSSLFKLRRLLLLFLRCLIVAAVALAFSQPVWLIAGQDAPGGEGSAVVMLIDVSASTGQQHKGVRAIHRLRAQAGRTLDALIAGEDSANIVYATSRPYAALPSMTTNLSVLREELTSLEPTAEHADMTAALALAGRMLGETQYTRRLVILTDLQKSNWGAALKYLATDNPMPKGTIVSVVPLISPPPGNLSLHNPAVSPHAPRVGRPTQLSVHLTNHSDRLRAATVQMHLDDQLTGAVSLSIPPRQTSEAAFTTVIDKPGESRVMFSLSDDALPIDDVCFLSFSVVQSVPVLVITDDDTRKPGTAGYFILRALAPHGDGRDRYDARKVHSTQTIWADMQNASAVFVGEVGILSDPLLAALHQYMDAGGGVVFFCGGGPVIKNLVALNSLAPDGMLPWRPAAPRTGGNPGVMGEPMTMTQGNWRSPMLRRFDEAGRSALLNVQFNKLWSTGPVDENAHTLLSFSDDTPALSWRGVGRGRLMLANFSPESSRSDLGKHGLFVALMQSLADDMTPKRLHESGGVVGRSVTFSPRWPIDPTGPTAVVTGPDGSKADDASISLDGPGSVIAINHPSQPGFYFATQSGVPLGAIPINIDPRESDLRRITADELQASLNTLDANPVAGLSQNIGAYDVHGRALWGWALAGALGLLGIEMTLLGYWRR